MSALDKRIRVEVLFDRPLLYELEAAATAAGLTGHTLIPALGGRGHAGSWSEDMVIGAESKIIFMTITADEKAEAFVSALSPLLDSHRLLVMVSEVTVVRGSKFS